MWKTHGSLWKMIYKCWETQWVSCMLIYPRVQLLCNNVVTLFWLIPLLCAKFIYDYIYMPCCCKRQPTAKGYSTSLACVCTRTLTLLVPQWAKAATFFWQSICCYGLSGGLRCHFKWLSHQITTQCFFKKIDSSHLFSTCPWSPAHHFSAESHINSHNYVCM
jgi:hypothetical protein